VAQDSLCPNFRIEYQTPDHELERVDLELATEQYCFKNITPMGSHLSSITLYGRIEKGSLRNHHAHSFEFISEFISTV
jgi:hypothetical protein